MARRLHGSITVLLAFVTYLNDGLLKGALESVETTEDEGTANTIEHHIYFLSNQVLATREDDNFPFDDSFQPENLELSERVPCGAQKCLYRLKSDPQVGYLVATEINGGRRSTTLESG